jgi:putative transposase
VVVDALPLAVREWECVACGVQHDRDVNAAKKLMKIAVSSTVAACGEESSGLGLPAACAAAVMAKLASVKQESSTKLPMRSFG